MYTRFLAAAILLITLPAVADEPTLEELEAACEAARQAKLEPLREQEIAKCKADRHNDPAWCERFYRGYGEGGRHFDGRPIPRLFDDLPECVAAHEARRRKSRR
ncbi:MAG: hypothetical protein L6Q83_08585 [Gammaproteobacteria bacterium]|nr:hypothetical protein [Gammaproteobacteria bacterium]